MTRAVPAPVMNGLRQGNKPVFVHSSIRLWLTQGTMAIARFASGLSSQSDTVPGDKPAPFPVTPWAGTQSDGAASLGALRVVEWRQTPP